MTPSWEDHRIEQELPIPDYLRVYFAATVPCIERGRAQAPKSCAYPFEGDGIYGCWDFEEKGVHEFTFYAKELGFDDRWKLKLTLDQMRAIASGSMRTITLWRCMLPECRDWLATREMRCTDCEARCSDLHTPPPIPASTPAKPMATPGAPSSAMPAVKTKPPQRFPTTAINIIGCPTIGSILDMGKAEAMARIASRDDFGYPIKWIEIERTAQQVSMVLTRMALTWREPRISVGQWAWEIAEFYESWGRGNRLRYAPERPIHRLREYRLRRISLRMGTWEVQTLRPDEEDKAALYLASANKP